MVVFVPVEIVFVLFILAVCGQEAEIIVVGAHAGVLFLVVSVQYGVFFLECLDEGSLDVINRSIGWDITINDDVLCMFNH